MKKVLFINRDTDVQSRVRDIMDRMEDYELITTDDTDRAMEIIDGGGISFVLFDVDVAMDKGVDRLLDMKDKYPDLPIVATTPIRHGQPGDAIAPEYKGGDNR